MDRSVEALLEKTFARTLQLNVRESEKAKLRRSVSWSATPQLRTRVETKLTIDDIFGYILRKGERKALKDDYAKESDMVLRVTRGKALNTLFSKNADDEAAVIRLSYAKLGFPWCVRYAVVLSLSLACASLSICDELN